MFRTPLDTDGVDFSKHDKSCTTYCTRLTNFYWSWFQSFSTSCILTEVCNYFIKALTFIVWGPRLSFWLVRHLICWWMNEYDQALFSQKYIVWYKCHHQKALCDHEVTVKLFQLMTWIFENSCQYEVLWRLVSQQCCSRGLCYVTFGSHPASYIFQVSFKEAIISLYFNALICFSAIYHLTAYVTIDAQGVRGDPQSAGCPPGSSFNPGSLKCLFCHEVFSVSCGGLAKHMRHCIDQEK